MALAGLRQRPFRAIASAARQTTSRVITILITRTSVQELPSLTIHLPAMDYSAVSLATGRQPSASAARFSMIASPAGPALVSTRTLSSLTPRPTIPFRLSPRIRDLQDTQLFRRDFFPRPPVSHPRSRQTSPEVDSRTDCLTAASQH